MRDEMALLGRLVTGRQLNGERKTNARWNHAGTELRDGAEHAGWWAHLPLRRRAAIRGYAVLWLVAHAVGLAVDLDRTLITLRVEAWIAIGLLAWVVVHKTRKAQHYNGVIVPVGAVVAEWLGRSRHGDPRTLVTAPLGFRTNPDKPIRVHLPETYREPDRRQAMLAKTVASRAGIKSHDWEVQLEGPSPTMLVRAALVPPDEVLYSEPAIRAIIEAHDDPSRLFLGLGVHDVPVWLDWNSDSPHAACSYGSGAGKTTDVRSWAAQTVRLGGRAVLLDGGKDGESHQDWARDEDMRPTPGVDFHPSIAEEHDALIAWENERARRARAVLNRTGEKFQKTIIVAEERNLTTPKLAAYWAAIREKEDPAKSPALQALSNLVAAGRSVDINVVAVAQRFDANVIGGGAVRASFQLRILSRFDDQARKMLIPEITPKPKSSNHLGRKVLCVAGEARDVQGLYMSAAEAIEMCRSGPGQVGTTGVPPARDRGRPRSQHPDSLGETGVPGAHRGHLAAVPDEPAEVTEDELEEVLETEDETPGDDELITLREAHTEGTVGGEWEALRKAAQRAGFPEHTDEGPRGAYLWPRRVLRAWWLAKVEKTAAGTGAAR